MIGDHLGKWVIFKELGHGAMGRVYLAQEEIGGRKAAIKVLAPALAQEIGFLTRFKTEIDALSQLDHPNIVRFYESGQEDQHYYYAMEYVDGKSLEEVLRDRQRLPWQEVLDIALQICPALRHVHNHGIIHRDIKPSNLLITNDGVVKLSDFGIVKVFAGRHLTATHSVIGTAEFISPEQASGKPVSKRSDLYSLGALLYMLLTGRPPFEGASMLDLLHKHRYGQFDRLGTIIADLPYEIDEIVCQLLEKEPDKRPHDSFVLQRQLERIKNKLERKHSQTQPGEFSETVAQNKEDPDLGQGPGPATLMSELVRQELDEQNRGGPIGRLLNRAWVLILLIALCIGILVWTFWPTSAATLFERGSTVMTTKTELKEWERAWKVYFQPLNEQYPDHPYQKEVAGFRKKIEQARSAAETPSEAKRLFFQGQQSVDRGEWAEAHAIWQSVITIFDGSKTDEDWVRQSKDALAKLNKKGSSKKRLAQIRKILNDAAQAKDANRWRAAVAIYRDDPWAGSIVSEIAKKWKKK